jgi:hypothetical protein
METQAAGAKSSYIIWKNLMLEGVKTLPRIKCYFPLNFPASINTVLFKVASVGGVTESADAEAAAANEY